MQQVRFAVLANVPDLKVVAGGSTLTSIRQGLAALLDGVLALMVVMFISTGAMVSVLFSAIITERGVARAPFAKSLARLAGGEPRDVGRRASRS